MKMSYRLVVFDWEGTLGDTMGHILNTLSREAQRMQYGELDEQLARKYVMLGLVKAVKKLFPTLSLYQQEQLVESVQQSLYASSREEHLFPGARQVVEQLQLAGVDLAIATNRSSQSLQRALQDSGMDAFFKVSRTASQAPPKPCPQMLVEIMELFGTRPDETLMIGDSVSDIEMAVRAGVEAIGVDFYHQMDEALKTAGAVAVFNDYMRLADYLGLPG